ncbi:MAG: hypothetical protein GY937_02560 [bacterium]|nr:hypothetical protein [bacterium]
MSAALGARAQALRKAAIGLAGAVERQDAEAMEAALEARGVAFDAFMAAARNGIDSDTRQVVEDVLALDRAVQEQARAQLSGIREELEQIRHARRVVTEKCPKEAPRFVSRRA